LTSSLSFLLVYYAPQRFIEEDGKVTVDVNVFDGMVTEKESSIDFKRYVLGQWFDVYTPGGDVSQVEKYCRQLLDEFHVPCKRSSCSSTNEQSYQLTIDQVCAAVDSPDKLLTSAMAEHIDSLKTIQGPFINGAADDYIAEIDDMSLLGVLPDPTPVDIHCNSPCDAIVSLPGDVGYEDSFRGWYDVQGCGECRDYCRWVGNNWIKDTNPADQLQFGESDAFWSCSLAGSKSQATPRGYFSSWPYTKCDPQPVFDSENFSPLYLPQCQGAIDLYDDQVSDTASTRLKEMETEWKYTVYTALENDEKRAELIATGNPDTPSLCNSISANTCYTFVKKFDELYDLRDVSCNHLYFLLLYVFVLFTHNCFTPDICFSSP